MPAPPLLRWLNSTLQDRFDGWLPGRGDIQRTAGPRVLWLYGSEEQFDWAYGVNARRLAAQLEKFEHTIGVRSRSRWTRYDIKFSFDLLIAEQYRHRRIPARKSVLRVGGPAPLEKVSGGDRGVLAERLAIADGIIVLSQELEEMLSPLHPRVFFVPNGLDLEDWNPKALSPPASRPFRAGLAASLRREKELSSKGYHIAREACEIAGVQLLAVGRGLNQVPHDRMIPDFYSQIDVLIHPTGSGKEACSNVIMEALALGIPVVTTPYAGLHGQLLRSGEDALVVSRSAADLATALKELKGDAGLRQSIGIGGRGFAERFHDLKSIARQYERVFDIVLRTN
jgi:glycosyltransferase involved in cell wall biosynthesis